METFSALLAICAGNSPVPGEFPTQRPVTRSFDVYFDLRPNKGWVNNREAGDLSRHRAHCDIIVMMAPDWLAAVSIRIHIRNFVGVIMDLTKNCVLVTPFLALII